MWNSAGIVRQRETLEKSLETVEEFLTKDVGRLLYLRLLTAKSILVSALNREESLGAHYIKN